VLVFLSSNFSDAHPTTQCYVVGRMSDVAVKTGKLMAKELICHDVLSGLLTHSRAADRRLTSPLNDNIRSVSVDVQSSTCGRPVVHTGGGVEPRWTAVWIGRGEGSSRSEILWTS
jgi:hypothetical protein